MVLLKVVISLTLTRMLPESGLSILLSECMKVVFPHRDVPGTRMFSPQDRIN